MVDIRVGADGVLFRLHKDLICSKVPCFNKMFNRGFKEASEQSVIMEDDDPSAFEHLVNWIYSGDVGLTFDRDDSEDLTNPPATPIMSSPDSTLFSNLLKLYMLSKKLFLEILIKKLCTSYWTANIDHITRYLYDPRFPHQASMSKLINQKNTRTRFISLSTYHISQAKTQNSMRYQKLHFETPRSKAYRSNFSRVRTGLRTSFFINYIFLYNNICFRFYSEICGTYR